MRALEGAHLRSKSFQHHHHHHRTKGRGCRRAGGAAFPFFSLCLSLLFSLSLSLSLFFSPSSPLRLLLLSAHTTNCSTPLRKKPKKQSSKQFRQRKKKQKKMAPWSSSTKAKKAVAAAAAAAPTTPPGLAGVDAAVPTKGAAPITPYAEALKAAARASEIEEIIVDGASPAVEAAAGAGAVSAADASSPGTPDAQLSPRPPSVAGGGGSAALAAAAANAGEDAALASADNDGDDEEEIIVVDEGVAEAVAAAAAAFEDERAGDDDEEVPSSEQPRALKALAASLTEAHPPSEDVEAGGAQEGEEIDYDVDDDDETLVSAADAANNYDRRVRRQQQLRTDATEATATDARIAMARPSPVASAGLVVTANTCPAPPVASDGSSGCWMIQAPKPRA